MDNVPSRTIAFIILGFDNLATLFCWYFVHTSLLKTCVY